MTMIAVGQGLRGIANRGMGAVAKAESVEEQQRMGIEAQKTAAEAQTMGTGAGIGGMYGATQLAKAGATATEAVGALNTSIQGLGTTGLKGGSLTFTPATVGAETLTGNSAKLAIDSAATIADAGAAVGTTGGTAVGGTAVGGTAVGGTAVGGTAVGGTAVGGTVAGGTGPVGVAGAGTATGAVGTATTAAAGTGSMASLAALASPIAIGLGVAFLINKLFG